TGTSTGLGKTLVELVLAKGEIVVATARRTAPLNDLKAKYPASHLLVLKLDVSKPSEITAAFAQVKEAFGRLDVVVNNAGWGTFGEVESAVDADARAMFDTNFWGAVDVSRAALAFFRDVNAPGVGGRLVQISSCCGIVGLPGQAFYCASKFALEAVTESLAAEIDPTWNIKVSIADRRNTAVVRPSLTVHMLALQVTLIALGAFATEGVQKITWSAPHPAYSKPELPVNGLRNMWASFNPQGDVKKAVEVFYTVAGLPDPPLHIAVGKDSIEMSKAKLSKVLAEFEKYEYLSENLNRD
ncbi:hypothetical protein TRAPUB_5481, partial [Trametes pubescens]